MAVVATTSALFASPAREFTFFSRKLQFMPMILLWRLGSGQKVVDSFKEKTSISVNLVSAGDAVEMLTKLN